MTDDSHTGDPTLEKMGTAALIMTGALILGPAVFAVVGGILGPTQTQPQETLFWVLRLMAIVPIPAAVVLPGFLRKAHLQRVLLSSDEANLHQQIARVHFQTSLVGLALGEAAALVGGVALLLNGDPIPVVTGWLGFFIVIALYGLTPARLRSRVEETLRDVEMRDDAA